MMRFPWWLSLMVGFLSLSQEILWVRLISFNYRGIPHAFSFVLANYLIGIAIGANIGKYFCGKVMDLYQVAALTLLLAGITDILIPVIAPHILGQSYATLPVVALAIMMTAGIKSVLFPIAHHLGSNQQGPNVGSSVSKIYFLISKILQLGEANMPDEARWWRQRRVDATEASQDGNAG